MHLLLVLLVLFTMNNNNNNQYHRSSKEVQGHIWMSIAQRNLELSKEIVEDGNFERSEYKDMLVTCLSDIQKNMEKAQACFKVGGAEAQCFSTIYAREQVHNVTEALESQNSLECSNLVENNPNITQEMVESLSEAIGSRYDYMSSEDSFRNPLLRSNAGTIVNNHPPTAPQNIEPGISSDTEIENSEGVNPTQTSHLGASVTTRNAPTNQVVRRFETDNFENFGLDGNPNNLIDENQQNPTDM